MNTDSQAAIIANDLDTLLHRIEALPAHPAYTMAGQSVIAAKKAIIEGRQDLHVRGMEARLTPGCANPYN